MQSGTKEPTQPYRSTCWTIVWKWCEHSLVSGALLVAVTVSSAAGVGTAAVPPPPLPGARAGTTPFSGGGARASPPAVTRTRPAVESNRSEDFPESHVVIVGLNLESGTTNGHLHPRTGVTGSRVKRTQTFCALCYVIGSCEKQNTNILKNKPSITGMLFILLVINSLHTNTKTYLFLCFSSFSLSSRLFMRSWFLFSCLSSTVFYTNKKQSSLIIGLCQHFEKCL